jgi:hypothetical protein
MRVVLKILAAPCVVALTLLWAILTFLFCYAVVALNVLSGLGVLVSIALFVTHQTTGGIVFLILSFLLSPLGIPAIAGWLIDKIDDLKFSLKYFITS